MRVINKVVIHCSDLEWGTVDGIRRYHVSQGWKDIGYHFVVENGIGTRNGVYRPERDGYVFAGRPIAQAGAHVMGHNRDSLGVCLVGKNEFTPKQLQSTKRLIELLRSNYGDIEVWGHRDLDPAKTCPNFDVGLLGFFGDES
jgi:N-acetylmuramoyl-L-alanine amidase